MAIGLFEYAAQLAAEEIPIREVLLNNSKHTTITAEEFIRGCMAEGLILRVDSGEVRIYGGNLKSRNEAAEVLAELNQSTAIEDDVLYELTAERDKYGLPYDNALEWALRDKTAAAMKLAELLREQGRADLLTVLEMRYWSWASWYQIANALNTSWPKVERLDAELLSIAKNSGLFAEECIKPTRISGIGTTAIDLNEGTERCGADARRTSSGYPQDGHERVA